MSAEVIELSKGADGRWVTINGVHVHIGAGGKIDKGPAHFEGKSVDEVDDHERSGGLLHKEGHAARKVEHAKNRMDTHGEHSRAHVDRTVEELEHMDAADVIDAAREHGIVGVKSKPKAIEALRQHLANNAEAKTRVDTMGEVRDSSFKPAADDDATRARIAANKAAGDAAAKAHAERPKAKSADRFEPGRTPYTDAATGEERHLVRAKVKGERVMWHEDAKGNRVSPARPYDANAVRHIIEPGEGLVSGGGGAIDRSEPAALAGGKTDVARKVRELTDRMGSGGSTNVTPAHIEATVAELRKMPEADVIAGAKELGIAGATSKARAIAMIKQHLENQNEASYRVDTMGHYMSRAVYLSAADAGDLTPALMLGQGYPTHLTAKVGDADREFPVAYFWKDAIAAGDYVHPTTKQKLSVDAARIDGWVERFHAMRKAGIEIPTPADHKAGALNNLGFVVDAKRDGDRLKLLHQVIGEDGAMAALRNRCSLCIEPDYADEKGRKWGDVFTHSAFTPNPVITGMGSFVPFVASRDGEGETPVFYLSADDGAPEMDPKQLREALGVAADVPDDKLLDKVRELKASNGTLLSRAEQAEGKVVTLSRTATPAKPSATELFFASKAVQSARDEALKSGAITPAVADIAEKTLLSKMVEPAKITLSRAVEDDDHKIVDGYAKLLDFYGIVKDNKPVATGSQTNVQLARTVPGGDDAKAAKAVLDDADAAAKAHRERHGIRD